MACDAATLAALTASTGLPKLSERDLMMCLASIYGVGAGLNAQTATNLAATNKLAALSEADLWKTLEAVLC
jgi:hypothetical protein